MNRFIINLRSAGYVQDINTGGNTGRVPTVVFASTSTVLGPLGEPLEHAGPAELPCGEGSEVINPYTYSA